MTFQPDIIISWDISEKDNPTFVISLLEYDPKVKHIVCEVLCHIDASELNAGSISINQILAKHHLYKSDKLKNEAEAALQKIKEDKQ